MYELRVSWTSAKLLASLPEESILSIIFCLLVEGRPHGLQFHVLINPGMFMLGDRLDAFETEVPLIPTLHVRE